MDTEDKMSFVNFECKLCDYEQLCSDNKQAPFKCPECGSKWYTLRFLDKPPSKQEFVNIGFADNERWSWALGCNENQLQKKIKQHPNAEWRKAPGGGYQMRIANRTEKKRRMKEAGFEEFG